MYREVKRKNSFVNYTFLYVESSGESTENYN